MNNTIPTVSVQAAETQSEGSLHPTTTTISTVFRNQNASTC